jgi:peroxiredoxin Q/BCP
VNDSADTDIYNSFEITMGSVDVGQKAPAFTAVDDRDQRVSLSDFKGRVVVLFFYPKDDTAG